MDRKIRVKYNGRRFPRIVPIQGGDKMSFQPDRTVLDLNEYDALFLLKSNSRLKPDKWTFTVIGVEDDKSEKLPGGWTGEEPKTEPEPEAQPEEKAAPAEDQKEPDPEPKPKSKKKKRMAT